MENYLNNNIMEIEDEISNNNRGIENEISYMKNESIYRINGNYCDSSIYKNERNSYQINYNTDYYNLINIINENDKTKYKTKDNTEDKTKDNTQNNEDLVKKFPFITKVKANFKGKVDAYGLLRTSIRVYLGYLNYLCSQILKKKNINSKWNTKGVTSGILGVSHKRNEFLNKTIREILSDNCNNKQIEELIKDEKYKKFFNLTLLEFINMLIDEKDCELLKEISKDITVDKTKKIFEDYVKLLELYNLEVGEKYKACLLWVMRNIKTVHDHEHIDIENIMNSK